jgi:putative alpha-1,2-mannosidase
MCQRSNGAGEPFLCPREPAHVVKDMLESPYIEGDAWHWAYFVPHDPPGLVALFPSPAAFEAQLTQLFEDTVPFHEAFGNVVPNAYYWAGNEHNLLTPWLFNYAPGACHKTQKWTRAVTHMNFNNEPRGLPGNDDYGALSSWLLFAYAGLYPKAGDSVFLVGSPRVAAATLKLARLGGGVAVLAVLTRNNSATNVYVESLLVNGVAHLSPFIERSAFADGATLEFFMTDQPRSGLCP